MTTPNESDAITAVASKLAGRFASVPRMEVDRIVNQEYHRLDGAPVRAYIAVLVEHAARQRLAHPEFADSELAPVRESQLLAS